MKRRNSQVNPKKLLSKIRYYNSLLRRKSFLELGQNQVLSIKHAVLRLVKELRQVVHFTQIKRAIGSAGLAALLSTTQTTLQAQNFAEARQIEQVNMEEIIIPELTDWDNDGDLDVIGLTVSDGDLDRTAAFLENIGTADEFILSEPTFGVFSSSVVDLEGLFLETGDIDGDGDLEAIFPFLDYSGDYYQSQVLLLENFGDSLTIVDTLELTDPLKSVFQYDYALVDFDDDGDLDLLTIGIDYQSYYVNEKYFVNLSYLENISTPATGLNFAEEVCNPNSFRPFELLEDAFNSGVFITLEIADFDNDGNQEIIFANLEYSSASEVYYVDNADGLFSDPVRIPEAQNIIGLKLMTSGDVDNDGDVDIMFENYTGETDNLTTSDLYLIENLTLVGVKDLDAIDGVFQINNNLTSSELELEYSLNLGYDLLELNILNLTGQIVYSKDLYNPGNSGTETIDISSLPSGQYFLNIKNEQVQQSLKFVKVR